MANAILPVLMLMIRSQVAIPYRLEAVLPIFPWCYTWQPSKLLTSSCYYNSTNLGITMYCRSSPLPGSQSVRYSASLRASCSDMPTGWLGVCKCL